VKIVTTGWIIADSARAGKDDILMAKKHNGEEIDPRRAEYLKIIAPGVQLSSIRECHLPWGTILTSYQKKVVDAGEGFVVYWKGRLLLIEVSDVDIPYSTGWNDRNL